MFTLEREMQSSCQGGKEQTVLNAQLPVHSSPQRQGQGGSQRRGRCEKSVDRGHNCINPDSADTSPLPSAASEATRSAL